MKELKGSVAAVTGAGSGIGRGLAMNLAKEGCSLALADIDEEGLKQTADQVAGLMGGNGLKVTTHVVDVADREQVYQFAENVVSEHGKANIIINNAGVTITETVEDLTYEDFGWLLGINLWGVIYGSKAFLPYLKQQSEGHIVNISSADKAARIIIKGIKKNKTCILVGADAHIIDLLQRMFPVMFQKLAGLI